MGNSGSGRGVFGINEGPLAGPLAVQPLAPSDDVVDEFTLATEELKRVLGAAIVHDRVQLAGGDWADWYLDAKQVTWGTDGYLASLAIDVLIEGLGLAGGFDAIAGVSYGGAPMALECAHGWGVPAVAVRNEAKDYGMRNRIVGPLVSGMRVVLVEDVVTTFNSLLSAVEAIQNAGAVPVAAVCLVNRGVNPNLRQVCDIPFASVFLPADLGVS